MLTPESYISGFVDGEGCFTVSFSPRAKLKTGWEVRPSFSVSQNIDRPEVLIVIKKYFGCGEIRLDKKDDILIYESRSLNDIANNILPHFVKYPLLSSKQKDFLVFKEICELMMKEAHLSLEGLREILELSKILNFRGRRSYSIEQIFSSLKSQVR